MSFISTAFIPVAILFCLYCLLGRWFVPVLFASAVGTLLAGGGFLLAQYIHLLTH